MLVLVKLVKLNLHCTGGLLIVYFFLLETYRSMESKFDSGKYSQKKLWEEVAQILCAEGYSTVTGLQCATKLRSLEKTYKSTKDHNNKSGNDRKTWPFYEIMEEIFSKKAWCNPVAVASSTGLCVQQPKDTADSDKSSKATNGAKSSLAKRLKQKEIHEENRNKRRREQIEMDAIFLEILEKLSK
ncbi:uncharacterized protein LOC105691117 isoform X2 [Athalia rosae]|uniref:uncharacterized protein LOC105691117 isoform X2 n=1 Tax=Athalia rosae TaxID=37344 RepID=UPI0020338BF1|nr:uncharacterized protein LOC105691117 isoform X2 [Athalia rosae]